MLVNRSTRSKRESSRLKYPTPPTVVPVRDWEGTLVTYSGLSVLVHGHTIEVVRDYDAQVATVRVKTDLRLPLPTEGVAQDLQEAANILAARAARFLGSHWKVVSWDGRMPGETTKPQASVEKVFGLHQQGSGV